ncbi:MULTISPECIES: ABC transporter permease [unclassified Fusibacter]|uniref:ABC transporter permease n=1 Tax=unclassified Fusibacter TaxID=2624464 RepID=UPI0013E99BA1|nr:MULTISPECIES: FtsX-like permease family protein [unclassified Fusibacter]MCK8061023.1 FtsX-like permease family protein [Fusibacter sp. A2]NPE20523.1 FtsX-like permease family protein [Fusibacter sp. A1]
MIRTTRGQFIAVTVVLAVGLLSYVSLNMTLLNLETTVNTYYEMTNTADIFSEVMRVPESQIEQLLSIPGVTGVNGRVIQNVKFDTGNELEKSTIRLISIPESGEIISSNYIVDGKPPAEDNEVMLLEMYAAARNLKVGSEFEVVIAGKHKKLIVSAIVANPEYIYLIEDEQSLLPDPAAFGVGYVTEQFAQSQLGFSSSYNSLVFKIDENIDEDDMINQLEKKIEKYGVIRLFKRDDLISARMVNEEIKQGKKSANVVPVLFLAVAAFIIAVMIGRIVKNDRITIGVFKAMGYSNLDIIWHYTKYALLIGLIGSAAGMLSGAALANQLAQVYTDTVFNIPILIGQVYPQYLALAMVLGSTFCIAAGFWGAKGIMEIHPAESMRPEAPKTGRRIMLERWSVFWNRVSFSWKIVIRNIFRSKRRVLFIVLGIALTFAITLLPFYMMDAFFNMFDEQYGVMYTMDYTLTLSKVVDESVAFEIGDLVDADVIEPIVEFPFEINRGWKSKIVNILGIVDESQMYHFSNVNGEPIPLPSEGIALTEGLAGLLQVHVGDEVTISSFIPGRDDESIVVTAIVEQPLGVNAYMNIGYMQRTLLDDGFVNGVVLKGDEIDAGVFDTVEHIKSAESLTDLMKIFEQFTTLTYSSIVVMIVASGILGFAIVYNSTIMSINERKLEFSSLRVLGFDKKDIFKMIQRENMVMTFFGILIGIPMGASMIDTMMKSFSSELYTMKVDSNPSIYILTGVMTLLFVLIAQFATYEKIQKLDFIEALKARVS